MPKSVPRLVLDRVRQELVSEDLNSNVLVPNVPNKSLSQELNNDQRSNKSYPIMRMRISLGQIVGFSELCGQNGDRVL